jgi:polyketide biosynthesis acyl carrier protein
MSNTATDRAWIARLIGDAIVEVLPTVDPAQVTGGKHLRDLGADSIDRVEIITMVLNRLGLDEPLSSFVELPDINAMVELLYERCT